LIQEIIADPFARLRAGKPVILAYMQESGDGRASAVPV